MKTIALAVAAVALLACGSDPPPAERELPPVSAPSPPIATHPTVESCLELVGSRAFADALSVCRDARRVAPLNEEVRAAFLVAEAHLQQPEEQAVEKP
jgi:hypothetical protein